MKKVLLSLIMLGGFSTSTMAITSGESDQTSFWNGDLGATIDWMVVPGVNLATINPAYGDAGLMAYLFQIEVYDNNPTDVELLHLSLDTQGVAGIGVLGGDDLDDPTSFHGAHNVASESEGFNLAPVNLLFHQQSSDGIKFLFDPLRPGDESETFFVVSSGFPGLGNATLLDSSPPSPWGSGAPGGEQVAVPVPDAASTLMLLGMAVTGLGWLGPKLRNRE